ncbi:MAG TPA: hypothetical protein VN175_04475 [Rhizomicrobium sp.]|jgi:hypothetical protein|nr:hypothetical protein [Rhizomicrobium sp.]
MSASQTGRTLYACLPVWAARAMLAIVLALTVLPALPHPALYIPGERQAGKPSQEGLDTVLYKKVVADIERGQNYYEAAGAEHRLLHYPTSPPQVFRLPTLAWMLSGSRFPALQLAALVVLYGAIIVLLYRELLAAQLPFAGRILSVAVLATGLAVIGVRDALYWHEVWAALLMALSLLTYRAGRWWPSVLFGLLACLIREIATPYLFVMAGFALYERRWTQAAAWLGATLLVAAVFALHIHMAAGLHHPGDLVSPGWIGFYGWDFAIATAKWNVLLHALPYPLIALALCLGVIGLAGAQDGRARRAAVVVAGYLTGFLVVGRPDNYYWGVLYAPLLPVGFLLAPAALRDLLRNAFARTRTA